MQIGGTRLTHLTDTGFITRKICLTASSENEGSSRKAPSNICQAAATTTTNTLKQVTFAPHSALPALPALRSQIPLGIMPD